MSRPKQRTFDFNDWKAAVAASDLKAAQKYVILMLETWADWDGPMKGQNCHPGVKLIADTCSVGTTHVTNSLAAALKVGLVRSVLDRLHPRKVLRAVGDAAQHPTPVLRVRASPRVARFHHRSRSLGSQPGIQPDKTPRA
jgi:hypothetical protein